MRSRRTNFIVLTALLGAGFAPPADAQTTACSTLNVADTFSSEIGFVRARGSSCFNVRAPVGELIRVRITANNPEAHLAVGVELPSGAVSCPSDIDLEPSCTFTAAAQQTITVRPTSAHDSSIRVNFVRLAKLQGCHIAEIGVPWYEPQPRLPVVSAAPACARVNAVAGDVLRIHSRHAISGLGLSHDVVRANGPMECAARPATEAVQNNSDTTCVIRRTGAYTVVYTRREGGRGRPAFGSVIQRLNAPAGCTKRSANGRAHEYESSDPAGGWGQALGAMPCFTFDASAGRTVRLRSVDLKGRAGTVLTEVIAPDGSVACAASAALDVNCTPTTDGQHTVLVRPASSPYGSNKLALSLRRIAPAANCAALRVGTVPAKGGIGIPAETDCYAVDAREGEILRLRFAATGGTGQAVAEVIGADGTTICPALAASSEGGGARTCTAPSTGRVAIIVSDSIGTGLSEYALSVQRLVRRPTGCAPIEFGAAASVARVAEPAGVACLTFAGRAGDHVRIRTGAVTPGGWSPTVEVVDPSGATTCTRGNHGTCVLAASGTHTLLVADPSPGGAQIGELLLSVQRLNAPGGCTALQPGAPLVSGALVSPMDSDCYTFSARADQLLSVQVIQAAGETTTPGYELLGPDGTVVCGPSMTASLVCDATHTGRYTVLIGGRGATTLAPYAIRVRLI